MPASAPDVEGGLGPFKLKNELIHWGSPIPAFGRAGAQRKIRVGCQTLMEGHRRRASY